MRKKGTYFLLFFLFCTGYTRIKFIHIPKTGGSTLHEVLSQYFSQDQIYPYRRTKAAISLDAKKKAKEMPKINHELVSGHFPYWFMVEKDSSHKESFTFTVLRDPVERVLSHYRFRKKANPEKKVRVDDVLKNWTCKMLCSNPKLEGIDLLEDARENLKKLDFVIFMDHFDRDVRTMLRMIEIDPTKVTIPKRNITNKETYDQKIIDKILKNHELDVALYRYALRYVGSSFKKSFQK